MTGCIFCKIVAREIPNYTVYEDEHNLAFLDISPQAKGHTMVIPKTHAVTLFELENTTTILNAVKKTMEKIQSVLSPDGYNVGWNQSDAGGQVVKHLHIHIMPRWDGDGGGSMHSVVSNPGDVSVEELAKLFE